MMRSRQPDRTAPGHLTPSGGGSLQISQLSKAYDAKSPVVQDVTLTAAQGEFLVLLGPSGCGKTTTLRCIAGFETPDEGEIRIDGRLVASKEIYVPPDRRNIGMVFQNYGVWPHMTVAENVGFPIKLRGVSRTERSERVRESLRIVGLQGLEDRSVSQLSGGQQQRVALARAVIYRPSLLLLDEPLSNLDAELRNSLRFELRNLQETLGVTSVYVTHDQSEAVVLGDRVAVMNEGRIEQFAAPSEIFGNPANEFVARFTGVENLLPCVITSVRGSAATVVTASGTTLGATVRAAIQDGASGVVAVRAENVVLRRRSPGAGSAEWLRGVVQRADFLGLQTRYVVVLEKGDEMVVRQIGSSQNHRREDEVEIYLEPSSTIAIPSHDTTVVQQTGEASA